MITKEELKKEVDQLPENLLDEVHVLLKKMTLEEKRKKRQQFTIRDFKGRLDNVDIRDVAYE